MHKLLFSGLFTLLTFYSATAQDTCRKITFQKIFHISQFSGPSEVIQTKDSGFLFTGTQTDELVGNGDGLLLKTNKYGEAKWIKAYNRTEADYLFFSSTQLSDSSYMSVAYINGVHSALQKTDKNGNLIWRKEFSSSYGNIDLEKILATTDNSVIVTGYLIEITGDLGRSVIIKFDEDGNIIWQKFLSNQFHRNYTTGIINKSDTILVNGILPAADPSVPDSVYIVKLSLANGNIYQSKRFWLDGNWIGNNVLIKRPDDNYVLSISFISQVTDEAPNVILALDRNLNTTKSVKLTNIGAGTHYTITPSYDNGFVMLYNVLDLSISYVIKFDNALTPSFAKFYSPFYRNDAFYFLSTIKQAYDSGYIIGGYKFLTDSSVLLLFKIDAQGNTGDCPSTTIPKPTVQSTVINAESFVWGNVTDADFVYDLMDVPEITPNNFDSTLCSNSTCDKPCTIYAPNGKIYLCHVPPGNTGNPQQLILPLSAVNYHLSNHPDDRVGLCGHPCSNFTLQTNNSNNAVVDIMNNAKQSIIYPNPSASSFTIRLNEIPAKPVSLTVFSADGKMVHHTSSGTATEINFGDKLAPGIYFVEVEVNNKKDVFKVIKIK